VVQVNRGLGLMTTAVIAVVAAVTATGLTAASGSAVEAPLPSVHAWVTTADGANRMSDRGDVPFHSGGSKNLTITVDPSRVYQTMDGFGASITDSSAHVLYSLRVGAREGAMRDLFSPAQGNELSILRQPMGASDFVAGGSTPTTTWRLVKPTTAYGTSASRTTRLRSCHC
jgi:glucosylceramidase